MVLENGFLQRNLECAFLCTFFSLLIPTIDNEDPELTGCPQSPMSPIPTDPGNNTANYSWVAPLADDNVAVDSLNSTHTSPAALPVGNNTITYTATDPAGNTAVCEFYVFVIGQCLIRVKFDHVFIHVCRCGNNASDSKTQTSLKSH